jgi:hypothetical protein
MVTKICKTCQENKNICEFSKKTKSVDGLMNDCKKCRSVKEKKYRELNPEKNKSRRKKYYENNKEKHKKYFLNRRNKNSLFKLSDNVRRRLNFFLKKQNIKKTNKTFELVGCSAEFLKEHLEKQFRDGMSWDNYGTWHVDHIIPLSSAKNTEELNKLCHYSNLQPLWAQENMSKGSKLV